MQACFLIYVKECKSLFSTTTFALRLPENFGLIRLALFNSVAASMHAGKVDVRETTLEVVARNSSVIGFRAIRLVGQENLQVLIESRAH